MNHGLPLVTLYLTERCNSRCVTCDYWRHGRRDVTLDTVQRLLPELAALGTRTALVSGGEPLLNPAWADIAGALRGAGLVPVEVTAQVQIHRAGGVELVGQAREPRLEEPGAGHEQQVRVAALRHEPPRVRAVGEGVSFQHDDPLEAVVVVIDAVAVEVAVLTSLGGHVRDDTRFK